VTVRLLPTADVEKEAVIGDGTTVWHLAQIRESAVVGRGCNIGRDAYVGPGVRIGDNCKIQNYALVYEPAVLGASVYRTGRCAHQRSKSPCDRLDRPPQGPR
jgi:UDP-2-acetamido-3-amino-2,3-dideoxy-glucuronate N-acetyltransferase